jgi:2-methylisocitrate lyase-like PEP mutase family enzyme
LVAEVIERARQYRAAGCDGLFVPGLADPRAISEIVPAIGMPLNLMVVPDLPAAEALTRLGVRRVSAGSAIAQAVYGVARRSAQQFLRDGRYDAMFENAATYGEMNELFKSSARQAPT